MITKNSIFAKVNFPIAIILLICTTLLVYANSLKNSFVWDDYLVIVDNNFIKSWKNFPAVFSKSYLSPFVKIGCCFFPDNSIGSGETTYRPVVTLSYFIDYSLWKLNPLGYHLSNLFLHILNVLLLFIFIDLIVREKKIALWTSLFFALHPVNSEAVNVISFREELLVLMFYLSSFILYIKLDISSWSKKIYFHICSLILFSLAVFSKEMAITLPVSLILYDYCFVFRGRAKELFSRFKSRYLGYVIVLLFYILVRFVAMVNTSEPPGGYLGGSFYTNILTMSKVFTSYIKWFLLPVGIHATLADSSALVANSFFDPWVLLSIALIITCIIDAIKMRKSAKEISFSMLWVFITLLPVSSTWFLSDYMASRYLYIPSVGFCFLAATFLSRLNRLKVFLFSEDFLRKFARDTVIVLLIFYSIFTMIRNCVWKNNTSLWSELVENYPNNGLAHSNLGACFKNSGLTDKAISEYKIAITLNPQLVGAYNELGILFAGMARYDEAIAYFTQSIKVDPKYLQGYSNLAIAYTRLNRWKEARRTWGKILQIDPNNKEVQGNLKKIKQLGYEYLN